MLEGIEPIATSVAAVLAIFVAWDKLIRPTKNPTHDEIKAQLEIRRQFSENSEEYQRLTRSIQIGIRYAYPTDDEWSKKQKRSEKVWSFFFAIGFTFWTFYLISGDGSNWAYLTGFIALGCLFGTFTNDSKKEESKSDKPPDEPNK